MIVIITRSDLFLKLKMIVFSFLFNEHLLGARSSAGLVM